jgi:putative endonuclease
MTTQQSRRHRKKWGRWAETLAVAALRLKGYRILRRNFRVPVGEIDIIACRRATVVFI